MSNVDMPGGSVGRAWVAEPARHDDVEVREQRQHLVEPEERVGPAVQENHGRPVAALPHRTDTAAAVLAGGDPGEGA
jgi:hypothetical protein